MEYPPKFITTSRIFMFESLEGCSLWVTITVPYITHFREYLNNLLVPNLRNPNFSSFLRVLGVEQTKCSLLLPGPDTFMMFSYMFI